MANPLDLPNHDFLLQMCIRDRICSVSFDFSEKRDEEYLERTCPYLTFAFFSGSDMSEEECERFAKHVHELGTRIVGITRGSKGAIFYDGEKFYHQGIKKVDAVDTMGAGESFIAGFLTAYGDVRPCLLYTSRGGLCVLYEQLHVF